MEDGERMNWKIEGINAKSNRKTVKKQGGEKLMK